MDSKWCLVMRLLLSMSFEKSPRRGRGFSLIELLLVLGVLAVLLVAAFVVYPQVSHANRVNQELSNLSNIQTNMRNMFATVGTAYTKIPAATATATLNSARIFPVGMNGGVYTGSNIKHAWGGNVTLNATTANHQGLPAGRAFTVNYMDVPSKACVDLVTGAMSTYKIIHIYAGDSSAVTRVYPGTTGIPIITDACTEADQVRLQFLSD